MTPRKQIDVRDIASPKPSHATQILFKRVLIAAKKDQDKILAKAKTTK